MKKETFLQCWQRFSQFYVSIGSPYRSLPSLGLGFTQGMVIDGKGMVGDGKGMVEGLDGHGEL